MPRPMGSMLGLLVVLVLASGGWVSLVGLSSACAGVYAYF